jgi:hypothetical protein
LTAAITFTVARAAALKLWLGERPMPTRKNRLSNSFAIEYHDKTTRLKAQLDDIAESEKYPSQEKEKLCAAIKRRMERYGNLTWFWYEISKKLKEKAEHERKNNGS